MCTVTFVPLEKGCIITHNRDENIRRKTSELPQFYNYNSIRLLYPKDQEKQGTWFCADEKGRVACILNGAFKKHTPSPPYHRSRGIIVLETFTSKSFKEWCENSQLENIEPFTIILYDQELTELRWDGTEKHIKKLTKNKPHIWSSSTLYSTETKNKREQWLSDWLLSKPHTKENLLEFHNNAGEGIRETNLRMSFGENHKTVSTTQFYSFANHFQMHHFNFISDKEALIKWS